MIDESILDYSRNGEHKGEHGRVLIVAGSTDYAGAAVLTATASEAVLRSGADLCIACCPEKIAWLVNNRIPDAITKKFKGDHFTTEHVDAVVEEATDCDVALVGPGLGEEAQKFAHDILTKIQCPKVVDADGIHSVLIHEIDNAVFTPHRREYEELLERSDVQEEHVQDALGTNIILLKGATDRIIAADREERNETGNTVMTKGGTGDVLAGLTAGFIAQGQELFDAACASAYLNGAVADVLQEERGDTVIASDIVKNLHRVL